MSDARHVTDPAAGPEDDTVNRDLADELAKHIRETLPARGYLVFGLLYRDELAPDQAAAALGVNRQVIYNWKSRIREQVDMFLARHGGEEIDGPENVNAP